MEARREAGRVLVTYQGQTHSIREWARITGLSESVLHGRLHRSWDIETTLTAPLGGPRPEGARVPRVDPKAPYAEDPVAQQLVRDNPGGMTLDEVGLALGITRERVRQIEQTAMRKLRAASQRSYGTQAILVKVLRDTAA